jgi:DNA-binding MarR family transcriptional regulator
MTTEPPSTSTTASPARRVVADTFDPDDPMQAVADRVFESWRELRRGSAREVTSKLYGKGGARGTNPVQLDVLELVVSRPEWRMTELAQASRVDPSTMTRTIDRMTRNGLVERSTAEDDLRSVQVRATPEGLRRFREIAVQRLEIMREYVSVLGYEDAAQLADLMERFVAAVSEVAQRYESEDAS